MGKKKHKSYGIGSCIWWKSVLVAVLVAAIGFFIAYAILSVELRLPLGGSQGWMLRGGAEDQASEAAAIQGGLQAGASAEQKVRAGADLSELLPEPTVSAKTAVVMDVNSGRVLYEKSKDEKVYPASTTKILTALLAVEQGNLEKKVKISKNASGVEGSSIYLGVGEEIPLRDLVYGLMLRSGNDAAIAIAEEIAGSTDAFVEKMNGRAAELEAKNTHFTNPNGLHNDQHYTTAYDMALLARHAMNNPTFKEVVGSKSYEADRGEGKFNLFYNKNKVVYQYEGGTGIKIGYTKTAGRTLVASSQRNGMELICVVMNAPDWFNDTYALMDYAYSNYEPVKVAAGESPLKGFPVTKGNRQQVFVGAKQDVICPVKKGVEPNLGIAYSVQEVKAPVSRWQEAGLLHIYVEGNYCYSEPLYYLEDIPRS